MNRPTAPAHEHTLAHLRRLDLLIGREVHRLRALNGQRADEDYRGLYVSDEEATAWLDGTQPSAGWLEASGDAVGTPPLAAELALAAARIAEVEAQAQAAGAVLPLDRVGRLFGLNEFERQTLLIGLAGELDLKYERLFAYLQDDVTKKRPTVDLITRLLCPDLAARIAARQSFGPAGPLLSWALVSLHDDPGARRPVLLARYMKLDERIAGFLLGQDGCDARLMRARVPEAGAAAAAPEVLARVQGWARDWPAAWHAAPPAMLIHGRYGAGKRGAAAALAAALGRLLLILHAPDLAAADVPFEQALRVAEREALLTGALLAWTGVERYLVPDGDEDARVFLAAVAGCAAPVALLSERSWEPGRALRGRPFLSIELRDLTYAERRGRWAAALPGEREQAARGSAERAGRNGHGAGPGAAAPAAVLADAELDSLAGRFRLTPGQIQDAISRARTLAWTRDPANGELTAADIGAACRMQAQHRLGELAHKLEPRYGWDDIVLPRGQLTTLQLMGTSIRQRATVYGDWGFDRKLASGKGLIALFAGPSGTGKTMAAGIIARDLGLDIYKIDLSAVVDKYIGETEKNLERIFSEAQDSNAVLFFDEADALFGKRSEVKDAHDRYANIEIAYLLQRTEEYDGLVILASNVKKNMDEAFVRRLHFTVDFPFPEEPERLEIWRRTFPPEAPLAADLDLPFLARKLKVAGGNIRNIILAAAFLAAEEKASIGMRHLVRAAGYEFQKMGKLVVETDFERYFGLVRG